MNQIFPATVFATSAAIPPAAVATMAEELKQWVFGLGRSEPMFTKRKFDGRPERNYNLKGMKTGKFLQHEEQRFGINLGWTDDASAQTAAKVSRWFLAREAADDAALRYAEPVALANGGDPSFIRYEDRTVGVNLGWSKTPVYEWKVLGGTPGAPVRTGERVALFNMKADECLIYFDRNAGGDIGWPTSKRWEDQLEALAVKVGKEAAKKAVLAALGL
ncbi:hypothetical protein [Roseicella aquatilis]|uniref:Uncharacterized protein n=1 Tax=Roseicella aquatilis TaxID=2527868 RepID=A0A4R4DL51_9PROT|nr:hypothetical protein [Roseicella aquatilis]TCZ61287.1 hypothetical protein EXY23_12125 [Roseicella aquatilis]